jgi:hypothetical protein
MEPESPQTTINIIRSLRERISSDPNIDPESLREFRFVTARLIADYVLDSLASPTQQEFALASQFLETALRDFT